MKDTAYTSLALAAHTDNTYFTDPSGLQAFHLLSHTDGDGGSSLLVDGFSCAAKLRLRHPWAHKILASTPLNWHASGNEGIVIIPAKKYPVLGLDGEAGELLQVRWNNDDRAGLQMRLHGDKDVEEWYEAARVWDGIVKAGENEFWCRLRPGRVLGG